MGAGIWIILLIVIACVAAFVFVSAKRNSDKKKNGEEAVSTVKASQITIYEYKSMTKSKICMTCDGENSPEATYCRICGQQINSKGDN